MSYILEALRRADAERSQASGAAPSDLAARQPGLGRISASRFRAAIWVGLGLVALAAALPGWWLIRGTAAEAPARPTTPEGATVPPALAAPLEAPSAPRAEATPPPPRWHPPVGGAASPILSPEPSSPVRPGPPVALGGAAPPAPPAAATTTASSAAPTPPAAASTGSAPGLTVTGATHSDNPAHRMLIINGRVVLEGQEVEPGLTLEVITPHSAVLNRRGARFNINY